MHGGFLEQALSFLPNFAFKVGVGRGKQSGVARIDACLGVVEASDENLRLWKAKRDGLTLDVHVLRLQFAEIDASDNFAVHDEEEAVAHEELRQVRAVVFTGNDFVHGEADGFQALELLNLADDGGLVDANQGSAAVGTQKGEKAGPGGEPYGKADNQERQKKTKSKIFAPEGEERLTRCM